MSRLAKKTGLTIIEVLISIGILGTASLGVLSYQYGANRQMKIAQVNIAATQVAQLLLEDWKSVGGDENYDPLTLNLGFTVSPDNDGTKQIIIDNTTFKMVTSWQDVATDAASGMTLRQITALVKWRSDLMSGNIGTAAVKQIRFTTYVRRDAGGD
jgi:Tfp pilus assembly protein PilV